MDPIRKYEIQGQVYTLLTAPGNAVVGLARVVVAAVAGKAIRVMGWRLQAQAAAASVTMTSSGGTLLHDLVGVDALATYRPDVQDVIDSGYFSTLVGEGLNFDVLGGAVYYNVYYLSYTP